MDNILIYAADLLWLIVLVITIQRHRLRFALMPLMWCAGAHLMFFAAPPDKVALMVGAVHLATSIGILSGYSLMMKNYRLPPPEQTLRPFTHFNVDKVSVQVTFMVFCALLIMMTKLIAYLQGAPLLDVLFGMRMVQQRAEVGTTAALLLTFTSRTPVVGIALGRLWVELAPTRITRIVWWLLFLAFITNGFSKGGRTAMGFPIMVMIVVDIYVLTILQVKQTRASKMVRLAIYSVMGTVLVVGMIYQSQFRAQPPKSFEEAFSRFRQILGGESEEERRNLGGELAAGLNDTVAFVVTTYGKSQSFTYGFSLYAMAVNPIPRAFWPSKPPGWGQRLAFERLNKKPWQRFGTSMAAGIAGEAYSNGGFAATFLFGWLFGILFGAMARRLFFPRSLFGAGIWLAALTWMLGLYRGDWLSSVNRGIYCLASAAIIYFLLRTVLGRGREYMIVDDPPAAE